MNPNYLDFEQPIAELEGKIEELQLVGNDNDLNITVCEMDENTYIWHTLLFPDNIKLKNGLNVIINNVHDNVYNYIKQVDLRKKLVYLNFCGIGGTKGVENFIYFINANTVINNPVYISLDNGQLGARESCNYLLENLNNINEDRNILNYCFYYDVVSERGDFKTFIIIKNLVLCNLYLNYDTICSNYKKPRQRMGRRSKRRKRFSR